MKNVYKLHNEKIIGWAIKPDSHILKVNEVIAEEKYIRPIIVDGEVVEGSTAQDLIDDLVNAKVNKITQLKQNAYNALKVDDWLYARDMREIVADRPQSGIPQVVIDRGNLIIDNCDTKEIAINALFTVEEVNSFDITI